MEPETLSELKKAQLEQKKEIAKISAMSNDEALDYIRNILMQNTPPYDFNTEMYDSQSWWEGRMKHRLRFEMSGYDYAEPGSCVKHNMNILNLFANLGIYDHTQYLFLDFYKGNGTLYLKYWPSSYGSPVPTDMEIDLGGYSTSEIIYEIFKLTILSGKAKRRRD